MKLWLKWEMLDIQAFIEAIDMKCSMENKRFKQIQSKQNKKDELEKLNKGRKSIKTIFMTKGGKVNQITSLNRAIIAVIFFVLMYFQAEIEMECFDYYMKTLIMQTN